MSQEVIEITEREIEIIEVVEKGPSGPTGPQANINYTVVSGPQTLSNSQNIAADTSGGTFTLTLPLNPNEGDSIDIFDYSETFDTNPLTIDRNGQRIESLEENLICNVEGAYFTMIYTGSTRGWQILPRYGTSGGGGESILTNQGDTLYRGPLVNERLPIGSAGQILKVAASGIPEWGNESGAVTSVNGATGAVTVAALNHTHEAADVFFQGLELLDAGNANTNGVYVYGGVFGGKGIYYKDKDSFIYWDGAAWMVSYNSDDIYSSAQNTTTPWQVTSWSVEVGQTSPAPSSWDRLTGDQWEAVVGQRINPTLRGTAAGKNVGTGADDVAAGNHAHGNLTNSGAIGTTANLPLKTGTNGVVEAGAFGTAAGSFCEGNDVRLSDDRDPNLHAATHAAAGSDPVSPSSIGAQDKFVAASEVLTSSSTTLTAGRARRIELSTTRSGDTEVVLPTSSNQQDDLIQLIRGASIASGRIFVVNSAGGSELASLGTTANGGRSFTFRYQIGANAWFLVPVDAHTHVLADVTGAAASGSITSSGLTQATARILGRTTASTGAVEEITIGSGLSLSAGELSSTVSAGIPATIVDAKGDLIVGSAADTAARLAVGATNGHVLTVDSAETLGVKWAAASGGDTVSIEASAADILSVASGAISADDAGADRIVFWDDSASKLAYLEAGSGLSISGTTMTVTATGGATNLWIPASAWIPKTTAGCGVDSRETSTNDQNFDELLFDAGSDEFADALVVMPSNYNNGTITARFYWTAASGSGDVIWGIQGRAFANDDALDTAAGTAQTVTDSLIAANDMHVSSATSAVTIGGTPAANTPIQFTLYRDANAAGDTLAVDARFLGAEIIFN